MTQALSNTINNSQFLSEPKVNKNFCSDNINNFETLFEKTKNNLSEKRTENNITNKNNTEPNNKTDKKNNIKKEKSTKENPETTEENIMSEKENTTSNSENNLVEEIQNTIEEIIPEDNNDTKNENLTTEENTDMNITNTEENTTHINNIINTTQTMINGINININETTSDTQETSTEISTEEDSDLNVTLNGKSLSSLFENIDSKGTTEETTSNNIVNLNKKETNTIEETDSKNIEEIIDEEVLKDLKIENIETETSSDTSSENPDLMQNQSAEEQGIKAMFQTEGDFADIKVDTTLKTTQNIQTNKANTPTDIGPSKIVEQISKQLEGLHNNSKVNIVLNPESLGKVSVQLINTKEGLSAQFTVATQEARNLIMKGLDGLKDTLMAHGVSVDNVTVKMNETQESNYQADWTEQEGSRGGNKEQNSKREEDANKQKFAETMFTIENQENGKV